MAHYAVRESPPLRGEIPIGTSKNAVLPIMCGALLTDEDVRIENPPELTDVSTLCSLLRACGCRVKRESHALILTADAFRNPQDEEDVRKMRASVLVLGPLLTRLGEARIPLPGGCAIGQRPIDQHLKGMSALGAKVTFDHGGVTLSGRLRGATIYLDMPSVGATENLMMAATLARGVTRIENAAKEPEIVDLAAFLSAMGAKISGAGTSTITVEGVERLHGASWQPIADRIEAGTMACACAITGGELLLRGARADHLRSLLFKLSEAGVHIKDTPGGLM
ncbi:MAG: UDP-N-acetylglucosamine 1-carboxyvinyltransferase, partial [Candidatus Ventricola sp.]